MAFTEDFSVFFDTDGFASEFTYTPKIGAEITVNGIFDQAFYEVSGGEVGIAGNQPRIVYETLKIPSPLYGDGIRIDGKYYTIVGIQPDGVGTTTLILEDSDAPC
jgi:hypothetical protein